MMLTLGVPTLNRYDLLPRLLASAAENTVPIDYLLLIDNGRQLPSPPPIPATIGHYIVLTPPRNLGVAASWNRLIARHSKVWPEGDLVIASDDVVLCPTAFEQLLERPERVVGGPGFEVFLWRLGTSMRFDEGFWPAYCEDVDMAIQLDRSGIPFGHVSVMKAHERSATLKRNPGLQLACDASVARFKRKWGRTPTQGRELTDLSGYYKEPWNDGH